MVTRFKISQDAGASGNGNKQAWGEIGGPGGDIGGASGVHGRYWGDGRGRWDPQEGLGGSEGQVAATERLGGRGGGRRDPWEQLWRCGEAGRICKRDWSTRYDP